ncbi:MAG: saccharopine dehydrogenase NADP-binding domain-containing protein [Anaerolineales bacterium]
MPKTKILILGGYGSFGSLIAEQFSNSPDIIIAGRSAKEGQLFARSIGVEFQYCDLSDNQSLRKLILNSQLVINAAGPFKPNEYQIPRTCIEAGCHYIDMADRRQYVAGITQLDKLAKENQTFVCAGASTVPAVTSAMIDDMKTSDFESIDSIRIALTAGNKNKPGVSTFSSILSYAGVPIQVWQTGIWKTHIGWGVAEFITFPPPVGKRRVQLCDVPDLELFPGIYEANSVIFKAGVELLIFNYALSILAEYRRMFPTVNLSPLAGNLVKISRLFKNFGSYSGAVMVWLKSNDGKEKSMAVATSINGARIPTAPAVLLAKKIISEGAPAFGAFPCIGFLTYKELETYFEQFGIWTVREKTI